MSGVIHVCKECGETFNYNKTKDGLNCNKCNGILIPLWDIDNHKIIIEEDNNQDKINKENSTRNFTINCQLDTTEFERNLDRLEKKLKRIKDLEETLKFDKALNEVKNMTININMSDKKIKDLINEIP